MVSSMPERIAILNIPHENCEESMKEMLEAVGYTVYGIGRDVAHLMNVFMRQPTASRIEPKAGIGHLKKCDLFVIIKHYSLESLHKRYPYLKSKTLWFDINGGVPGEYIAKTPFKTYPLNVPVPYVSANKKYLDESGYKVSGSRYVRYIPLARRNLFLQAAHQRKVTEPPVCLVHNPYNWGYGMMVQPVHKRLGVKFYGSHRAPNGLIKETQVAQKLVNALCYVHIKSHDCPGCSLYQAMLTGCPVVLTSQFLRRTLYTDLYIDNDTCLVVEDHEDWPREERALDLEAKFKAAIERLKDPAENTRIGSNGRRRIVKLMWQNTKPEDVKSFKKFIEDSFK